MSVNTRITTTQEAGGDDGFCLISYRSETITIELLAADSRQRGPKVSIVIGPNGSGKSQVLSDIINEFVHIDELRQGIVSNRKSTGGGRLPREALQKPVQRTRNKYLVCPGA